MSILGHPDHASLLRLVMSSVRVFSVPEEKSLEGKRSCPCLPHMLEKSLKAVLSASWLDFFPKVLPCIMVLEPSCNMQFSGLTRRPEKVLLRHKNNPALPFYTSLDGQHREFLMGSLFN